MLVPNKVMRFNESVMGKLAILLKELKKKDLTIIELYLKTQQEFEELDEFIISLDVLYILDSIEIDFGKGVVRYVERNSM
ncbi:hypothetical protein NXZ75_01100 [Lysinibacillus sphaericus]|uniref:ABC-three component system middle component 7 n=1 Tax=Lysinibacillus sphaericus TaxID=1421 RepID=UPI002162DBC2|nr:ABC-three component system middle component 7 [Lysinibacillus sphaericus]MCS1380774.1 hypothetical protein [Lysinibacillus sphaericus]